jgi:DNA-binding IclR family transcriptional regulator
MVERSSGIATPRRGDAALEKAMNLYLLVAQEAGSRPLGMQAQDLGIPLSTARRMIAVLLRKGLVVSTGPGRFEASGSPIPDQRTFLAATARRPVRRLARRLRRTVHLGILENGMVTYLLKEQGGATPIFTQPDQQLEAYCSGIGKMLLAHLPADELDQYLSDGPFVALTPNTITDPSHLRTALQSITAQGFALDDGEIDDGLRCVAVPIADCSGTVFAALSCSWRADGLAASDVHLVRAALEPCSVLLARALTAASAQKTNQKSAPSRDATSAFRI